MAITDCNPVSVAVETTTATSVLTVEKVGHSETVTYAHQTT